MNYEEALAYYPGVVAAGDVAAFVAPLSPSTPDDVLWAAWQTVVAVADESVAPLVFGVRERLPDLPHLGAAMQAAWAEPHPGPEWTSLNAFAATLTAGGIDFLRLGLRTVGLALEAFDGEPHVPAAVAWFRLAGPQLVAACKHGRTFVDWSGGSDPGFSVARWILWRGRMEAVSREGFTIMKRYDREIAASR
ncbi:DUF3632 domain-containing protein [Actinoplanes sp. CA-142083]|uniref:DUF3632 domain-containing protein n=1 Tax=Actinoplanes sp. CA-142083 TaxID=3239903 RepID=UPI003D8E3F16